MWIDFGSAQAPLFDGGADRGAVGADRCVRNDLAGHPADDRRLGGAPLRGQIGQAPPVRENGDMRKRVAILGSTGSIGTQALEVVCRQPRPLRGRRAWRPEATTRRCWRGRPSSTRSRSWPSPRRAPPRTSSSRCTPRRSGAATPRATIASRGSWPARRPRSRWPARRVTSCSTAMTGAVGLEPTLAALETGATLALANKESLIVGGELVTAAAKPGQIVPVDSEHSALAQALRGESVDDVRRLLITASGGPFRGRTREELADVTPDAGDGAPHLGHGSGHHDQLGDPGEQGSGGHRGAPAVRHRLRPHRRRGAPARRSCTRWSSSSTAPRWCRRRRRT